MVFPPSLDRFPDGFVRRDVRREVVRLVGAFENAVTVQPPKRSIVRDNDPRTRRLERDPATFEPSKSLHTGLLSDFKKASRRWYCTGRALGRHPAPGRNFLVESAGIEPA